MTADELWRLPKIDKLYELVQGELVVMSPAGNAKVQEYLDAGSTEAIVITPKMKIVKIFRHGQTATILRSGDNLRDLKSVAGFECHVDEIFA